MFTWYPSLVLSTCLLITNIWQSSPFDFPWFPVRKKTTFFYLPRWSITVWLLYFKISRVHQTRMNQLMVAERRQDFIRYAFTYSNWLKTLFPRFSVRNLFSEFTQQEPRGFVCDGRGTEMKNSGQISEADTCLWCVIPYMTMRRFLIRPHCSYVHFIHSRRESGYKMGCDLLRGAIDKYKSAWNRFCRWLFSSASSGLQVI